jgi:transcription elongation factor Elf1
LGYGFLERSDVFYEKTGWVYKNKGIRKTLVGTIHYLLTHCGLGYVGEKRVFHVVTWWGCIGYNKICIDKEIVTRETIECKKCGLEYHEYRLYNGENSLDKYDEWLDEGVYVMVKKVRSYKLRTQKQGVIEIYGG